MEKALREIINNSQKYVGMFKPTKKLMEDLVSQREKESRDHFYLEFHEDIDPNLVNTFVGQRVPFFNSQGKNIIAIEISRSGWLAVPIILIAMVPGKDNKKDDFSFDSRQGVGSSYIVLAYKLNVGKKWKKVQEFFTQEKTATGLWLQDLLNTLKVDTAHKKGFKISEYFGKVDKYKIEVF